jgi:hypothetical protein
VFIENKAGRLAEVTGALAKAGVNIRAASVADTADFGILRLIADKDAVAMQALSEAGFTAKTGEVLAVELEDKPGSLASIMEVFQKESINIEYLYPALNNSASHAVVVFKLEDIAKAAAIAQNNGMTVLNSF